MSGIGGQGPGIRGLRRLKAEDEKTAEPQNVEMLEYFIIRNSLFDIEDSL